MAEQWITYRVWFPTPTPNNIGAQTSMEVSAHPLRNPNTVKHQVWLMLVQQGHDVDPRTGGIDAIGTEEYESE